MKRVCDVLRFRVDNGYNIMDSFNHQMSEQEKETIFKDPQGNPRPKIHYFALCKELEEAQWDPVCERPEYEADGKTSNYFLVIYQRHTIEHHHSLVKDLVKQAAELAVEIFKEETANGFVP